MRVDEYDNIVKATVKREDAKDLTMDKFADSVFEGLCAFLKEESISVCYEVDQLFIEINEKYKWTYDVEGFKYERI